MRSFRGGVHPEDMKNLAKNKSVELLPAPETMVFHLSQHVGAPCEPCVSVGERVKLGQKIADSSSPVSSPVHSSVSGVVKSIAPYNHPCGAKLRAIIVENDFKNEPCKDLRPCGKDITELKPEEIVDIVRRAGIVGLGGAGFPTHYKISSALGKKIDFLIINGVECEPYISSDYRLMLDAAEDIIIGIRLLLRCFGLEKAFLAIEDNKPDAAEHMAGVLSSCKESCVEICQMKTKYPQGGEKQLIKAIAGRELPGGKLPADVGCMVFNVATCAAICRAYRDGMPLIQRIVTVSGPAVAVPRNLSVMIGTPLRYLFERCGGFSDEPRKIVVGGPMMGMAQYTLDVPVIKTTGAVLAFSKKDEQSVENPVCIGCGKCVGVCPLRLMPNYLNLFSQKGRLDLCERYGISDCIECGACAYICPGRVHIVQAIRSAKARLAQSARR